MLAYKCIRPQQPSWLQNPGMDWFGWHLWSSSSPLLKPLLKQAYLQPVAQNCVQLSFEYPQGHSPNSCAGAPVPSSFPWALTVLAPVSPCLSGVEEPVTAPSTAGVASPIQSGVEGSPPQTSCRCSYRLSLLCLPPLLDRLFASFAVRAHCCLVVNLRPRKKTLKAFLQCCFPCI